jgi:aspartyl-tRNA(Asn)/glutamyl-tRNA(Gln) amidotransferase subunit C
MKRPFLTNGIFYATGRLNLIDEERVLKVANLAGIELEKEELSAYTTQLSRILEYFQMLEGLDTSQCRPCIHALDLKGPFREDRIQDPLPRQTILGNTIHLSKGSYLVPKVLE